MERVLNFTYTPFDKHVVIDSSLLRTGDSLAIVRLDGLDPLVCFGTGGRTGHVATVLVDDNGEVFVVESTDANPFGKVYWPPPYGIIITPWKQWVEQAYKAEYMAALLPMNREYKIDSAAMWKFFREVEGMPYGYRNFLFSFLDTYPMANLPAPMVAQSVDALMEGLDRLLPKGGDVGV